MHERMKEGAALLFPPGQGLPERGQGCEPEAASPGVPEVLGWERGPSRGASANRGMNIRHTPEDLAHPQAFIMCVIPRGADLAPSPPPLPPPCHLPSLPASPLHATARSSDSRSDLLKWEPEAVSRQPQNVQRLLMLHRTRCGILPLLGLQATRTCPQLG